MTGLESEYLRENTRAVSGFICTAEYYVILNQTRIFKTGHLYRAEFNMETNIDCILCIHHKCYSIIIFHSSIVNCHRIEQRAYVAICRLNTAIYLIKNQNHTKTVYEKQSCDICVPHIQSDSPWTQMYHINCIGPANTH